MPMNHPTPRPFLPSDRPRSTSNPFVRAAAAVCIAHLENARPADIAQRLWPRDDTSAFVARAATTPTTTTTASALATTATTDFLTSLGPQSAASQLLSQGITLTFDRSITGSVPNLLSAATFAGFTGQGSPIPVFDFAFGPNTLLTLQALKGICVFTEESLNASNVEAVVRQVLGENLGLSLDALMFTASAGGLLSGVGAGSESATADLNQAMIEDLTTLLSTVSPVAANFPIAIVTSPTQAVKLKLRLLTARDDIGFIVLASSAVPDGTVIAVAANTLVSATGSVPTFEISMDATVALDTTPSAIVDGSGTPAPNTRSLYQTGCIGLKVRLSAAWALRSATGISLLENCIW
jgi:hypothetical protein